MSLSIQHRRIRDKYEAELREIELSERNTQERYNELKAKLADAEGEGFRLSGLLKQKEQEVEDVKKVSVDMFLKLIHEIVPNDLFSLLSGIMFASCGGGGGASWKCFGVNKGI